MSREEDLEDQVRFLAAGFGLTVEDPANAIPADVQELVLAGDAMAAMRVLCRNRESDIGLVAAKRIVDAIGAGRP